MVRLSVIVPVYNGAPTLHMCLERAFASSLKDFELIVVDDHSSDRSAEIARSFPCRVATLQENRGPGVARNAGAQRATGEILYFLDADILVQPDTFARVLETFEQYPEYDAIFGSFEKTTGPGNFASVYKNLLHHYTHQTSREEASTFCGGFGAIRREAFTRIGGFDPQWRYLEDVELGLRLRRAGRRILLKKDLQATHLKRYTIFSLMRSDLIGRAIPWTRMILESRKFENDLNTKTNHVASVPVAFLLLAALAIPSLWLPAALPLAIVFIALNGPFLGFICREHGLAFALRSAAMCWFGYLYSGAGAVWGLVEHSAGFLRGTANVPESEIVKSVTSGR